MRGVHARPGGSRGARGLCSAWPRSEGPAESAGSALCPAAPAVNAAPPGRDPLIPHSSGVSPRCPRRVPAGAVPTAARVTPAGPCPAGWRRRVRPAVPGAAALPAGKQTPCLCVFVPMQASTMVAVGLAIAAAGFAGVWGRAGTEHRAVPAQPGVPSLASGLIWRWFNSCSFGRACINGCNETKDLSSYYCMSQKCLFHTVIHKFPVALNW